MRVKGQKLSFHRIAQLTEVRSADRPAHGNKHVRAGLDQHPFINGHVNLALRFGFVDQNSRRERRHTIESVWQESKRALARLRDNARHAGLSGEDLKRQEHLKSHECRRHVRPSLEVALRVSVAVRAWLWPATRQQASARPWV